MTKKICLPEDKVKALLFRFKIYIDNAEREVVYLRKAYEEIKKELRK